MIPRVTPPTSRSWSRGREVDNPVLTAVPAGTVGPGPRGRPRPPPAADLGRVDAMASGVLTGLEPGVDQGLPAVCARLERWNVCDHVDHQQVPVDAVQHDHVEWRGGGALLCVTTDVEPGVVGPPVDEAMYERGVAVEGEDHWPVGGEQRVELTVRRTMGAGARRLEPHQIHHVHHSDRQFREALTEAAGRRQHLQSWHVSGTTEHDVGFPSGVAAGPGQQADAPSAVGDGVIASSISRAGLDSPRGLRIDAGR
jgi:hypothetical protein